MKISDAAKLLGISTDTIRYYEKEGVITPKRTSKNNYRDLDNRDIISLLICIYNRKIGYSMKESVEYVEGIPVSKITDILNKKIDELELEVKETKNLINYLTTLKMESEIDFYNIGNYWITVEPKCYLLPYAKISQSEICFTKDNPRYYAKLFEYLPFINQREQITHRRILSFRETGTKTIGTNQRNVRGLFILRLRNNQPGTKRRFNLYLKSLLLLNSRRVIPYLIKQIISYRLGL